MSFEVRLKLRETDRGRLQGPSYSCSPRLALGLLAGRACVVYTNLGVDRLATLNCQLYELPPFNPFSIYQHPSPYTLQPTLRRIPCAHRLLLLTHFYKSTPFLTRNNSLHSLNNFHNLNIVNTNSFYRLFITLFSPTTE
jgi:hypothetical protein